MTGIYFRLLGTSDIGPHADNVDTRAVTLKGVFIYKLFIIRDSFTYFIIQVPKVRDRFSLCVSYISTLSECIRVPVTSWCHQHFKGIINIDRRKITIIKNISKSIDSLQLKKKTGTINKIIYNIKLGIIKVLLGSNLSYSKSLSGLQAG